LRGGCRFGGFGGLRAAALRRDRLASPGAAPLSWLRLTPRCSAPPPSPRDGRFGGCGNFRVAALRRARLASLGTALPSSIALSPRASAAATAASAAFTPPRCAATAAPRLTPHRSVPSRSPCASASASAASASFAPPLSPRLAWRRAAQHHRLRLARRLPLPRPRRLSCCRSAPRSPRPALGATLLGTIAFGSCVGLRVGGFGSFRAVALRRARRASLWTPRCSAPSPSLRALAAASAASAAFTPPRCAATASPRLAPRCSAPPLRLARRLPPRRLRRLSRRRAAPRSPRLASGSALLSITFFASRLSCRFGGCGGLIAAVLRRARLALLGSALLGTVAFASRIGCRFDGCGGLASPRRSAVASPRLTPRCPAPSPSPRASAAASAASAASASPRCAALASPRLAPRCSASSSSPRASAAASAAGVALSPTQSRPEHSHWLPWPNVGRH